MCFQPNFPGTSAFLVPDLFPRREHPLKSSTPSSPAYKKLYNGANRSMPGLDGPLQLVADYQAFSNLSPSSPRTHARSVPTCNRCCTQSGAKEEDNSQGLQEAQPEEKRISPILAL